MDEQEGLRQAGLAIGSDKEITVTLPIRELWLIVSGLQLTVSPPGLHEPLKTICEGIGRKLGALIVAELPQVGELLEQGWHREYDWIDDGDYDEPEDDDWDGRDDDDIGDDYLCDDDRATFDEESRDLGAPTDAKPNVDDIPW